MIEQDSQVPRPFARWKLGIAFLVVALAAIGVASMRADAQQDDSGLPPSADPQRTVRVVSMFRSSRETDSIATGQMQSMSDAAWKTYCRTQVAAAKSDWHLQAALRDPVISQLPVFGSSQQATAWLHRNLRVGFIDDGELMYVMVYCKKDDAEQVKQIVDSVAKAYYNDVEHREKLRKLMPVQALEMNLSNLIADLNRKHETYLAMARELGNAHADDGNQAMTDLIARRIGQIDAEIMRLEGEMLQQSTSGKEYDKEYHVTRLAQLKAAKEDSEAQLRKRLERSVELESMRNELVQQRQFADDLRSRLAMRKMDQSSPLRVEMLHPALVSTVDGSMD